MTNAYWWNERPNFGDALAPFLLERFAGIKDVQRSTVSHAQVISIGSVLEHVAPEHEAYILGAGKLHSDSRLHLHTMRPEQILALRGPISASGIKGDYILGDPGLLADELVGYQEKEHQVGILPHWSDNQLEQKFATLLAKYNPLVIDPAGDPLDVVRAIGSCHKLVTSSLHGVIVADSFGMARRFEYTKGFDRDGGLTKLHDYSQSIGTTLVVGETVRPNKFKIEDVKDSLFDAYREFGSLTKAGLL